MTPDTILYGLLATCLICAATFLLILFLASRAINDCDDPNCDICKEARTE